MGNKYILQCAINSARNRIDCIEEEIREYKGKIDLLEAAYKKRCNEEEKMEQIFARNRIKNSELQGFVRGVAAMSVMKKYEYEYSPLKSAVLREYYEQIKYYINYNIEKFNDEITDRQAEIRALEYKIRQMEKEIRNIIEEEREALNEQFTK